MKGVAPLTAAIAPSLIAEILMDADRARITAMCPTSAMIGFA